MEELAKRLSSAPVTAAAAAIRAHGGPGALYCPTCQVRYEQRPHQIATYFERGWPTCCDGTTMEWVR